MMQAIQRRVAVQDAPMLLAAGKRLDKQGRSDSARFMISLACDICPDLIEAQVALYRLLLAGGDLVAAQALRDRVSEGSPAARMALDKTKIPQFSLDMLEEATTPAWRSGPPSDTRRVLYVLHNSLPYASGGYATRGHGLAGGLKRRGFDIHCLTRPGFPVDTVKSLRPQDVPAFEEIDGLPYYRSLTPLREQGHSTKYYAVMAATAIDTRPG